MQLFWTGGGMQRAIGQTATRKSLHKDGQRCPAASVPSAYSCRARLYKDSIGAHLPCLSRGSSGRQRQQLTTMSLVSDPQSKACPPPSKFSFAPTQQHSQDSIHGYTAFCSEGLVTRSRTTSSFCFVSLFRACLWVAIVISHPFTCMILSPT